MRELDRLQTLLLAVALFAPDLATSQTFTKITSGSIANDSGSASGVAWGDYDGDGRLDLFVGNFGGDSFLYRNNPDGTFSRIQNAIVATDGGYSVGCAWGDFDNDGDLDLFVTHYYGTNVLYRNEGNGTFTRAMAGGAINESLDSTGCAWGDYDNDGWLDLFVANGLFQNQRNSLFHNNRDGTFTKMTNSFLPEEAGVSFGCAWGDYDNDGLLDLFIARVGTNVLYHNEGNGAFRMVTDAAIANDQGTSIGCAWGDYDNDGYMDLFVARRGQNNLLYHNDGNGTFTRIIAGDIVTDIGNSTGGVWADFDNDGFLDLFVSNSGVPGSFLYHNNGDGSFVKASAHPSLNSGADSIGCAVADYNGDGFLDLFVGNFNGQSDFLFRNDGNANHWITINCKGVASNTNGIGAKLTLKTVIRGVSRSQMRQIGGGDGRCGQSLQAHFGLGDAPKIDNIRVEWPSGQTLELHDIPCNQELTLSEKEGPGSVLRIIPNGGLFTNSISVRLSTSIGIGIIRYTLDGTDPTPTSSAYTNEFNLTSTGHLRANVFVNNFPVSEVIIANFVRVYAIDDGIPASWRAQFFGPGYLTDPRVPARADPDGDGANNLQEYTAGTNPLDPLSGFKVDIRAVPLITWDTISNETYRILRQKEVGSTNWVTIVPAYRATNSSSTYVDVDVPAPKAFYLIQPLP